MINPNICKFVYVTVAENHQLYCTILEDIGSLHRVNWEEIEAHYNSNKS